MLPLRHLNKHDENFKICMSCLTLLCTHIENMNAGDWISMRHLTHIAASAGLAHTKMHSKYIKMKAKQKRKEKNEHRRGWGIEIKTKYANWNMKNERNVLVGEKNTPTNERTNKRIIRRVHNKMLEEMKKKLVCCCRCHRRLRFWWSVGRTVGWSVGWLLAWCNKSLDCWPDCLFS